MIPGGSLFLKTFKNVCIQAVICWFSGRADAARSGWMKEQLTIVLRVTPSHQAPRLLFALLDETPLPSFAQPLEEETIAIYGKNNTLEMHGIDDLIVRLYWLIYRNTQHKGLD